MQGSRTEYKTTRLIYIDPEKERAPKPKKATVAPAAAAAAAGAAGAAAGVATVQGELKESTSRSCA